MRINKIINWFSNSIAALESVLWTEGDSVQWTEGDDLLWGDSASSDWILASTNWDDTGIWIDSENWND